MLKPKIAITLGDPAGVGPEVVYKSLVSNALLRLADFTVIGDKKSFFIKPSCYQNIKFIHIPTTLSEIKPGKASAQGGIASYNYIKKAVELALKKEVDAIVTAPVSKVSWKLAGLKFEGHTELLQELTKSRQVEMLMVAGRLRTLLLTRHIPITEVPSAISTKKIIGAVSLVVKLFGDDIRVAICGLNPHAGDAGLIGEEESKIIVPAVRHLLKKKLKVVGPLPSDSAFIKMFCGEFDICISMYHDQGIIPLKVLYPEKVVNVTLGLPFLRTSPGHGVAFDIAGKDKADSSAMIEAIRFAVKNYKKWQN